MITILDVAIARGATIDSDGFLNEDDFARVGLAIMGGCAWCGATIAAYNAHPTKRGCWACPDCVEIEQSGFETIDQFESFESRN